MKSSEIIARLLELRGVTGAEVEKFLAPSLKDLADPSSLPGVDGASRVLLAALEAKRHVVVFGDYDCDGVCATAILVGVLTRLAPAGARVDPFLPERLNEGYGMSDASVARLLEEHPDVGLVVTVDNGINSVDQVAALRARGVSVVITDHHLPGERLPAADALVNPKVAAPASLQNLCGAGVAFLLANHLVGEARARGLYDGPKLGGPLLVLAGLATVTDIMPLVGQNRILVAEALRNFRVCAPLGLKELHFRAARNARAEISSKGFGFMLGPRINAAGRLASGMDALDLILETNRERVREYALRIDLNNTERKAIEQKMTDEALAKVVPDAPAQVIDLPAGHPGVAGIVAARVMEYLGSTVPVCVLAGGHGSGRAPDGFNLRDAFVACDEVLERYGGHAAAGGFSVRAGQVDRFREMLVTYCRQLRTAAPETSRRSERTDLWVEPADLSLELAEALRPLEPFGEGNPVPVFGLRGLTLNEVSALGAESKHLAFRFTSIADGGEPVQLRAIWWGQGDRHDELRARRGQACEVRCNLAVSDYQERHAELRLVSLTFPVEG